MYRIAQLQDIPGLRGLCLLLSLYPGWVSLEFMKDNNKYRMLPVFITRENHFLGNSSE
jgi:hypothetical protein